jgi:hypothetical protein
MIKILKYTPYDKPPIQGFIDISIDAWHLEIRGISLVMKDGKRWFNLPSKEYTKEDGSLGYAPIMKFTSSQVADRFKVAMSQVFDEYCKTAAAQAQPQNSDEVPF